jgi:acyl-CoA oxidase
MTESAVFSGSLMNHYGLFLPTIEVHGSDKQVQWWSAKARKMEIVGCYAQTELGHGSNVRGLQTIAEYDAKTQEFVLNTPTLRSMKWWPGTLGKVATHALVYAQLITDGKEHGVHSFMVQIRDENHKPLPGIELGDLGPKLGDHANDTGFMKLDNVRIPREFMLSRYQEVSPDGQLIKSPAKEKNAKLLYTTMIFTRGAMVKTSGGFLARAATIATRYSCVRTQGFLETKRGSFKSAERQIIDYQVQRYRVLKQVAMAYAIKFTGSWLVNRFKDVEGGDYKLKNNVEDLTEIAATSGGLKALCTFLAWSGIEDCRKCCGGNGYLMSSGVAPLSANYVWQTTAEGDWIILTLQTGQFLLKCLQGAMSGEKLSDTVSYLSPLQSGKFDPLSSSLPQAKGVEDFHHLDFLLSLFKHSALMAVVNVGQLFQQKLAQNNKFEEAVNSCAIELCNAVRSHCFAFMLSNFVRGIQQVEDKAVKEVLTKVCALFAVSNVLDDSNWNGLITSSQVQMAKVALSELLTQIRPNAVALVDSFDIPDRVLGSTIGRFDGNVYEALYEQALKSPLNQKDPFDGYKEHLQPHLDLEFLKKGNTVPQSKL